MEVDGLDRSRKKESVFRRDFPIVGGFSSAGQGRWTWALDDRAGSGSRCRQN